MGVAYIVDRNVLFVERDEMAMRWSNYSFRANLVDSKNQVVNHKLELDKTDRATMGVAYIV
jgi:hypothetical protein